VYARPGRGRLQAALEGPLGTYENLHLAGDYFAELNNVEVRTCLRASFVNYRMTPDAVELVLDVAAETGDSLRRDGG
jgi:hypothetical protein